MARIQIIPSKKLTPRSLRARDYLLSPGHLAQELVDSWAQEEGLRLLLRKDAPAMRNLVDRAERVIARAIEEARTCLLDPDHIECPTE